MCAMSMVVQRVSDEHTETATQNVSTPMVSMERCKTIRNVTNVVAVYESRSIEFNE